jgi:hypothetical protein
MTEITDMWIVDRGAEPGAGTRLVLVEVEGEVVLPLFSSLPKAKSFIDAMAPESRARLVVRGNREVIVSGLASAGVGRAVIDYDPSTHTYNRSDRIELSDASLHV